MKLWKWVAVPILVFILIYLLRKLVKSLGKSVEETVGSSDYDHVRHFIEKNQPEEEKPKEEKLQEADIVHVVAESKLQAPSEVSATVRKDTIDLTWKKVPGVSHYVIQYEKEGVEGTFDHGPVPENFITLSGVPSGKYSVRIGAEYEGEMVFSDIYDVEIEGMETRIKDIEIEALDKKTMRVSWPVIQGCSGYKIYVNFDDDVSCDERDFDSIQVSKDATSHILKDLARGYKWYVGVVWY